MKDMYIFQFHIKFSAYKRFLFHIPINNMSKGHETAFSDSYHMFIYLTALKETRCQQHAERRIPLP